MKSLRSTITTLCASAALATLSGSVLAQDNSTHASPSTMDHSKMMDMNGMKKTGNADYDFAAMMRHHHQMGVQMAEHELKNGKNAEMKQMAQNIVDAQKKEIATLDAWLAKNKPAATSAKK